MELHFYPGKKVLLVKNKGIIHGRYEAWGGPASIGSDIRMPEEPTWSGSYIIDKSHAYRSNTWTLSRIKWGAALKDMPTKNDVWYQLNNGNWASINNDHKITRNDIINLFYELYGQRKVPGKWVFNDFGPIAIRWFKDTNGNLVLDGKETLSGQMFHTTQYNEAEHARSIPLKMVSSHGCIHLKPAERDRLISLGAFKPGTQFTVHKYHEIP